MNAFSKSTRVVGIAILAAAMVGSAGCTSLKPPAILSLDNTWPFRDKDKPKEGTPVRMVCTWSDTVMTQPAQKPQRGFGGRIMFYGKEEKKPILVDGQLVVYAFDETNRQPTDNKPTRRYVFPPEQIPLHMSKSEIGASYSFWLPWDEVGGPKTEVSLICRFEPKGGPVVTSEQTRHPLPGSIPATAVANTNPDGTTKPPRVPDGVASRSPIQTLQTLQAQRTTERTVAQANYEMPATADVQSAGATIGLDGNLITKRMSATTINLPTSYQLPSAATLAGQTAAAGMARPAPQAFQPIAPVQMMPPQAIGTIPTMPAIQNNSLQQVGTNQLIGGAQPAANGFSTPAAMTPQMQALAQMQGNFNNSMATAQQPAQGAMQPNPLQLQMLQQKMLQQQAQQQKMLPTQIPGQQPMPQIPMQASGTAAVSYPASAQYYR